MKIETTMRVEEIHSYRYLSKSKLRRESHSLPREEFDSEIVITNIDLESHPEINLICPGKTVKATLILEELEDQS